MGENLKSLRDWERFASTPYPICTEEQAMDYEDLSDYDKLPQRPDVTVIVLAYNHAKWIRDCLESLLNQKTKYSYEVFVSEDCSPDRTVEICKIYQAKYPEKIRLFAARHNYGGRGNGGVGGRVPRAVLERAPRYVMWCEGDDYWVDENKIEQQVAFLDSHPEVDACANRFNTFYCAESRLDRTQEALCGNFIQRIFSNGFDYYHISALCVRLCAYQVFVDYAKKIGAAYDMNLLYSLELGKGIYVRPGVVSVYRRTGEGIWSSCDVDSMREQHHRTLTINAQVSRFPASIFMYAQLIAAYWSYARYDFLRRRDYKSLALSLARVIQYSVVHPLSVVYCLRFFIWGKVVNKIRRVFK